jgi:hypothetical protein
MVPQLSLRVSRTHPWGTSIRALQGSLTGPFPIDSWPHRLNHRLKTDSARVLISWTDGNRIDVTHSFH